MSEKKFEDLKFERITQPLLFNYIPKYLFEQVKDWEIDIDKLCKLSETFLNNPCSLFFVLVDDNNQIQGIFWANANIINNCIDVILLSINKEYQFDDAIKNTLNFINTLQENATVRILASRTAKYEKAGFKKTKTLMEIKINGDTSTNEISHKET